MTVIDQGNVSLDVGVAKLLYETNEQTNPENVPGIIDGHINSTPLASGDTVEVQLQLVYDPLLPTTYTNAGKTNFKLIDEICFFTPLEVSFGWKIILTLLTGSTSSNVVLPYVLHGTAVI